MKYLLTLIRPSVKKSKSRKKSQSDYLKNKEKARELVHAKLKEFNKHYNFAYNRVAIRNQKTKWGSCSSKNNLNFNYKIVYLPEELADYLVVHELCHLKELNHSKRYWALVAETMPNYKTLQKKLREFKVR